jgi:dipeptidyl aminopeptidase/acylaminoacyl peptidase
VAFGSNKGKFGAREIWLMGPGGEQPRKLFEADENHALCCVNWSPDGQRILYLRSDESGDSFVTGDLKGGNIETVFLPSETKTVNDATWLPDGRLLYSMASSEFPPDACNFWTLQIDPHTGKRSGQPQQLTNWNSTCLGSMSVTADGKQLAFQKWMAHMTSYVADLKAGGTQISAPRHFPLSESSDGFTDWTVDGKGVLFVSNRSGHFAVYKQALTEEAPESVVPEGYGRNPRVTPDGQSVLYLGTAAPGAIASQEQPLMRTSINGGPSQSLFIAKPWSVITCARPPSQLCAIGEPSDDNKEAVVTAVDQEKGRGRELARFSVEPNANSWWVDLSPDGTRIAVSPGTAGPISIISLRGEPTRNLEVKDWTDISSFTWAADQRGLFVVAGKGRKRMVLYVDLQGRVHPLWESLGASGETLAVPSLDNRHLGLQTWTVSGNMWLLENF